MLPTATIPATMGIGGPTNPQPPTAMTEYIYVTSYASDETPIVDAQTAGEELDRIRRSYGGLSPAAVVDESRPQDAPLHPVFEWNDQTAAERYREHQATTLIRQVKVAVSEPERSPVTRIHRADEDGYEPLPVDDYDPLAFELSEAIGAVVQAHRLVEQLRIKAARTGDTRKRVAADVAAKDLEQAEEACCDAETALQGVHQPKVFKGYAEPAVAA